jgi:hypothetical protein
MFLVRCKRVEKARSMASIRVDLGTGSICRDIAPTTATASKQSLRRASPFHLSVI